MDAVVLQRADHLQARAIAHVREARVAMPAEVTLQNAPVLGAVEERAPALQLQHPLRCFLGVQLRHAPVVQHLAAPHRVAEVHLPVVLGPDVAERGGDAALGHHGVRLAEQRLAHEADRDALRGGLDGRAQPRAAGSDDDDVVLVGLVVVIRHYRILTSLITPIATRRM